MPNPFTRAQTLENAAFLRALRRTGNVREAAREIGKAYGTMQHRRGRDAAFAARWSAALVAATARLRAGGGARRPGEGMANALGSATRAEGSRTLGGEEVVIQCKDGTLQVRRAQPGKLTRQCEQAFLAALSATANVKLSAAAAGAAEAAFYRRKRNNPGFAREWRLALAQGYEALEMALVAGTLPDSGEDDAWRHNAPPPVPPMTANQALQLLYLHQKEARLGATRSYMNTRIGETGDARRARVAARYTAGLAEQAEDATIRAVLTRDARMQVEAMGDGAPVLPELAQVTGWSRAKRPDAAVQRPAVEGAGFAVPRAPDPAAGAHHPETALFGGWRIGDLTEKQRALGRARMEARRGSRRTHSSGPSRE